MPHEQPFLLVALGQKAQPHYSSLVGPWWLRSHAPFYDCSAAFLLRGQGDVPVVPVWTLTSVSERMNIPVGITVQRCLYFFQPEKLLAATLPMKETRRNLKLSLLEEELEFHHLAMQGKSRQHSCAQGEGHNRNL